jgi:drug/metabolite transporter (DMT)-like permease
LSENQQFSQGLAFGVVTVLIWGAWPVTTRFGVQNSLTPYDITAIRFFVSGMLLLPFYFRLTSTDLTVPGALVMTLGAGAPYMLITAGGFAFAPASHGGVIIPSTMLVCTMIGSCLFYGDRPDLTRIFGYVLVLAGILVVGADSLAVRTGSSWIGDLLFALGGVLWAVYTLACRQFGVSAFHATIAVCVLSLVTYVPVYAVTLGSNLWQVPLREILIQALFQGIAISIVGMITYTRTVALLGPARGSLFAALVPCATLILAYPVLGERPSVGEIIGLVFVTVGMVAGLDLLGKSRSS